MKLKVDHFEHRWGQWAFYFGPESVSLTINQSDTKNKKSLDLFEILKNRLDKLKKPINEMQLSDAVIDYHANWVQIADNDKLAEHSDKYLIFALLFDSSGKTASRLFY